MTERPADERHESLWWLALAPGLWVVHLLACYITAAIFCAKLAAQDLSFGNVRIAIASYTAAALLGIGLTGLHAWRRHAFGRRNAPHASDTPEDRYRFLGYATMLLSGLSAIAVVYVAIPAAFVETCR